MSSIDQIIHEYQKDTPFFLIRTEQLEENISSFRSALDELWPNSIIAYSVKTNSLPWLLNWMNEHGVYAECFSDEEYELAELSGYSGNNIVFNGPIKTKEKVLKAFEGNSFINIDSEREVALFSSIECSDRVGIRVNVDTQIFDQVDVGYIDDGFRFGFSDLNGDLKRVIDLFGSNHIGLHLHVNSITRSVNVYKAIAAYAARIIQKYNLTPSFVDIGGGFFGGVPGKTTPMEYIAAIKAELDSAVNPNETKLIIEPGSAAVGSVFELYTKVIDVKDTGHARIVTTDGSRVYIDPLWQKKSYMHTCVTKGEVIPRQVICGYTCMDHDRLMVLENERELSEGDYIVYHRVGNYTTTFGGPFIRPFPDVYALVGDELVHARHKMSMQDYYRIET